MKERVSKRSCRSESHQGWDEDDLILSDELDVDVVSAGCGKEVVIQVPPPDDKKLLCLEYFKK